MPANIWCVQPGGGPVLRLELAWGRLRRWRLRRFRAAYVARMAGLRSGHCPDCPHDIVDPRDLEHYENVCGYAFPADADAYRWRERLGVARRGLAEIVVYGGACVGVAVPVSCWQPWLALLPAALVVWIVAFFRDPARVVPDDPGILVAPADGTVDDLGEVDHHPLLGGPAVRVGIFLSLFDVHINRAPAAARVLGLEYRPGRHRATYRVGALEDNEQLSSLLELADPPHRRVVVRQIAGPAARRIVCTWRPGQVVGRGVRFGLIKFGSRTELYLPRSPDLRLEVRCGQKVRAGATIVARMADCR